MALLLRQKVTIILLLIYWPGLFTLAHIPIPQMVREAGVSDKSVHFLAYLILTFFLWFSVSSSGKVNWRKAVVWWILCVIVAYGIFDELSQSYVGRTRDPRDLVANLSGTLAGLVLFSVFTFWPSALIVAGAVAFGITNIARANLGDTMPVISAMFHLLAYGVFTTLWIRCIPFSRMVQAPKIGWLVTALVVPVGFLLAVKLFSLLIGRTFDRLDVLISIGTIVVVVGVVFLMALYRKTSVSERRTKFEPAQE